MEADGADYALYKDKDKASQAVVHITQRLRLTSCLKELESRLPPE
jgi:hypothetical protein